MLTRAKLNGKRDSARGKGAQSFPRRFLRPVCRQLRGTWYVIHDKVWKLLNPEPLTAGLRSFRIGAPYTANELPQPQVLLAFGLVKVNPREFRPCSKSTCMPIR